MNAVPRAGHFVSVVVQFELQGSKNVLVVASFQRIGPRDQGLKGLAKRAPVMGFFFLCRPFIRRFVGFALKCEPPIDRNMRQLMEWLEKVIIRSGRASSLINQNVVPNIATRIGDFASHKLLL